MNAKKTDLKELEGWYEKSGNQLMLLYGGMDCRKEQLIKEFCVGKKYFYYRCRQLSAQEQMQKMGEEIQNAFQMKLSRYSYDEFFNRVKSGDASKLVIVIDEAQYAIKRDPEFVKSILKLKMKRLYPGPVMIILASSSIVWATQDAKDAFGDGFRRIDVLHKVEDLNFLEVVRTTSRKFRSSTLCSTSIRRNPSPNASFASCVAHTMEEDARMIITGPG